MTIYAQDEDEDDLDTGWKNDITRSGPESAPKCLCNGRSLIARVWYASHFVTLLSIFHTTSMRFQDHGCNLLTARTHLLNFDMACALSGRPPQLALNPQCYVRVLISRIVLICTVTVSWQVEINSYT